MTNEHDPAMPGHRYAVPVYLGAGVISTGSHYATTIISVELLHVAPLIASATGFAVGAAVKYWLNYFVAFKSIQGHAVAVPRFAVMLAITFVLNAAFFAFFNAQLGLHYMVAQVLTTGALIPPGYLMSRLWVFRAC